mmetsp:Transcript_12264/g.23765  ORF Transcript_12264/g.23765 Transcript_12264/m.23765 type:complete len:130 (+) Transcript_12264:359-748(+)
MLSKTNLKGLHVFASFKTTASQTHILESFLKETDGCMLANTTERHNTLRRPERQSAKKGHAASRPEHEQSKSASQQTSFILYTKLDGSFSLLDRAQRHRNTSSSSFLMPSLSSWKARHCRLSHWPAPRL